MAIHGRGEHDGERGDADGEDGNASGGDGTSLGGRGSTADQRGSVHTVEDADGTSRGEVFDLLSNHRRRYVIHYCKREDGPVELGTLAEYVAAWELGKDVEGVTSAERKRVYTSLQQTHLPTLDRAGMIEFDDRRIALTENARALEVYLDVVPGNSVPWGVYYLGLAALSSVVLAGLWLGVIPTGTVPELGWTTLIVALFAGSAAVHVWQTRRLRLGEVERPP